MTPSRVPQAGQPPRLPSPPLLLNRPSFQYLTNFSKRESCDCQPKPYHLPDSAFNHCRLCACIQHIPCSAHFNHDDYDTSQGLVCNICLQKQILVDEGEAVAAEFAEDMRTRNSKQQQSEREIRTELVEKMAREKLWKAYCLMPKGVANATVVEQTKWEFGDEGEMVLVQGPPEKWVEEMCARFMWVMDEMRTGGIVTIMDEAANQTWDGASLIPKINAEVMWVLHRDPGAYKVRKEQLGVLAELLNLERKGKYWKG